MNTEDFNFDDYEFDDGTGDLPVEKQLGFFFESAADFRPDFDAAVQKANEFFTEKKCFVDEDEYEWTIQALNFDETKKRLAWVEWRFKQGRGETEYHNYYLKARQASSGEYWRREIETYNPYFGCDVKLISWVDNAVLLIYEDKHNTYAARLDGNGVERIEISPEWKINDGVLIDEANERKFDLQKFENVE